MNRTKRSKNMSNAKTESRQPKGASPVTKKQRDFFPIPKKRHVRVPKAATATDAPPSVVADQATEEPIKSVAGDMVALVTENPVVETVAETSVKPEVKTAHVAQLRTGKATIHPEDAQRLIAELSLPRVHSISQYYKPAYKIYPVASFLRDGTNHFLNVLGFQGDTITAFFGLCKEKVDTTTLPEPVHHKAMVERFANNGLDVSNPAVVLQELADINYHSYTQHEREPQQRMTNYNASDVLLINNPQQSLLARIYKAETLKLDKSNGRDLRDSAIYTTRKEFMNAYASYAMELLAKDVATAKPHALPEKGIVVDIQSYEPKKEAAQPS